MQACHLVSHPVSTLCGDIVIPGDKSISHRALMLGAISEGITTINGFLEAEDCLATLQAFQAMGVKIERITGEKLVVHGVGKSGLEAPAEDILCKNAGTMMRLLAGILVAQRFPSVLTGDESLLRRPMTRISYPLQQMGASIQTQGECGPLRIEPVTSLKGLTYIIPEASAQVKSCLLLAGLYAQGETVLVETATTRDHTERMLKAFSFPCQKRQDCIVIQGSGIGRATEVSVPGDVSSAAFFIVAATLLPHSSLWIRNVGINPTRMGLVTILKQMGAKIEICNQRLWGEEWVADFYITQASLRGVLIPSDLIALAIDEFPVLCIAASCAKGRTIFQGLAELRFKESDRIASMVHALQRLGIKTTSVHDEVCIEGGTLQGGIVNSQQDHRVAMALAIAGSVAAAPITVLNCSNVATSFPSFTTTAKQVKLDIMESYDDF